MWFRSAFQIGGGHLMGTGNADQMLPAMEMLAREVLPAFQ